MFRIVVTLLFAMLATGPSAAAWEMSELMVYLWGTPKVTDLDAKAKALAEAGFTVVDWEPQHLDVLQKHGLKAMVHDPTPGMASTLSGHPAVWGYHCGDEPYPEDEFPPIAARFEALKKADPHHPAFVNMLSTAGEFLRTYMDLVRPEILSFDYYQWWWGSDRYFEKLEQFREAAMIARVPLGSCIEVTANPGVEWGDDTYLPDNARKLRQSLYTNLRLTDNELIREITKTTRRLDKPRGDRLPLYLWPAHQLGTEDEEEMEILIEELDSRGIAAFSNWRPGSEEALQYALRLGKFQQRLGSPISINATACTYAFFDGDLRTAHVDEQGEPFFDSSFPTGRKMGCPFTLDSRLPEMKRRVEEPVKTYKEACSWWAVTPADPLLSGFPSSPLSTGIRPSRPRSRIRP